MRQKLSIRILTLGFMLLGASFNTASIYAEQKIVERSSEKTPEWMMRHPEGFLVCMSEGPTLGDAQRLLEQEILRQVASAVAIHFQGEITSDSGKEGDKEWDNFRNTMTASIARLPFISDVTLAKCKDTYWDHAVDKATGKDTYRMTALYPFDEVTRNGLITQYETLDAELTKSLERLEGNWKEVNSTADAAQAEAELESLAESFPDSGRRQRCRGALDLYRSIPKSLSLEADVEEEGLCRVRVMRGERPFHTDGRLEVTSECAFDIKVKKDTEGWTVRFNTADCLKDESNSLKMTLREKGTRLKTTVSF